MQVHAEQLAETLGYERRLASQHLVDDDAERIDVAAMVDLFCAQALLGRHVDWRAHQGAGASLERIAGQRVQLGDAEVEDLHPLARGIGFFRDDKQVVGLEVAMNDALGVGSA